MARGKRVYFALHLFTIDRLALGLRSGQKVQFQTSRRGVSVLLRIITEDTPWVVVGHDAELEGLWTRECDKFIAQVDRRRKRIERRPRPVT